jgi:hypothetical protein
MKTTFTIIVTGTILSLLACTQTAHKKNITEQPKDTISKENAISIQEDAKPDYILFGIFCGECHGECATMYKFDIQQNKLFADHTDSYWKYESGIPMQFSSQIINDEKIVLAKNILRNIPESMITTNDPEQRFGCPDCTDGCGIFMETQKGNSIKKFYIDNQTQNLSGEIKTFADFLQTTIRKIEHSK